jgi:hypothetical protein
MLTAPEDLSAALETLTGHAEESSAVSRFRIEIPEALRLYFGADGIVPPTRIPD